MTAVPGTVPAWTSPGSVKSPVANAPAISLKWARIAAVAVVSVLSLVSAIVPPSGSEVNR